MIIPSIDISRGRTVQLVGGEEQALDAGDPRDVMERLSVLGEVAVIDIDAARGEGDNSGLIGELCAMGATRVGGGIRDVGSALDWLDRGAQKVILGTAATPEILTELPAERVIAAVDSRHGRLVTHGWREQTDEDVLTVVRRLEGLCGGFLVTFVEREGRLGGTDLGSAARIVAAAGRARVTIAGGITSVSEIRDLDDLGADAQVGMALYTGMLAPGEALAAPLRSDRPDELWPTVVTDESGRALGLAYSSQESLNEAIETRSGVYQSRSRGRWVKGGTSGATQELVGVKLDCDRDTLLFTVRQTDGFCHLGSRTCWGEDAGIGRLARRIGEIAERSTPGNTSALIEDRDLLHSKLREEVSELIEASDKGQVVAEVADLLYFTLVKTAAAGVGLEEVAAELDRRELKVRRRPMTAKDTER